MAFRLGRQLTATGLNTADDGIEFSYRRQFLGPRRSTRLLRRIWLETEWQQQKISLFGRRLAQPRLSCWQGDPGICYSYSGLKLQAIGWHPELSRLRRELQQELGTGFNSVLLNAYRNERDSMGWHSDDEKELGEFPLIASISLGATRRFLWRPKSGNRTFELPLEHGSLLVMQGKSQSAYQHSLPKVTRPVGLRINLTFRNILSE